MSLPGESVLISGHPDFVRMSDIPRLERKRERHEAGDAIAKDATADYRRAIKRVPCLPAIIDSGPKGYLIAKEVVDMSRMAYVFHGDEVVAEDPNERRAQVALHVAEICMHVRTFYPLSAHNHYRRRRKEIKELTLEGNRPIEQFGIEWAEGYEQRFMEAHDLGLVAGLEALDE